MFYESELRFFCEILQKCHIPVTSLDPESTARECMDALRLPIGFRFSEETAQAYIRRLSGVQPGVLYRISDPMGCQYLYFSLPMHPRQIVLVIGPYITEPVSEQKIMEWSEALHISPAQQKQLYEFCCNTPLVRDTAYLYAMLDTLGERMFSGTGFLSDDVSSLLFEGMPSDEEVPIFETENPLVSMKNMELRYAYENEMMDAVARGHIHKADTLFSSLSQFPFDKRSADPIRNLKNYCIIMNTLLRKAAEKGGVHPLYIDRASTDFALRMEQYSTPQQLHSLMREMFTNYCKLVRKHSMKSYSPPVQKAITCIEVDLAGNLNLRSLSHSLNISSSYLSTLFKKETGQTLTDYINQRRVKHARHLLESTRLQVQTIAQHCGIMDVHYFSKIFKKVTGMTPKAYREHIQKQTF